MDIFETFKPRKLIVKNFVDYYYIDVKPNNTTNEFQCFPHFNNTISIYKSHIRLDSQIMKFVEGNVEPFQIFTPIRDKVLNVKQVGKVHRIVIVFNPFGIQQFYQGLDFSDYIIGYEFFSEKELKQIFSTTNIDLLTDALDSLLEKRYMKFENQVIEKAIKYIFSHREKFLVTDISTEVGVSRQHLNRVFQHYLGISVKKFYEIVLFRRSLNRKLFERPDCSFTDLAYEFDFNDQSHFNKRYLLLTKNSPRSFFIKGVVFGKEGTFWHLKR